MRTFLKILGGLVVLGAAVAGLVFWLTSGITDTANAFLSKLRTGDTRAAYELTSPGFQKATAFPAFERFVASSGLKDSTGQSWSNRKIEGAGAGAVGTLTGSIKDAKGSSVPARMQLTKKDDKWVVHSIRINRGGADQTSSETAPGKDALIKLVHESNIVFTKAIEAKNLKSFHAFISDRWRKQITEEKLAKAFQAFIDGGATFSNLGALTPVLDDTAKIDSNGVMRVTGHYDTKPMRITFRQSYIREAGNWKLFGYGFNMKKSEN